jgi:hypothetical protein
MVTFFGYWDTEAGTPEGETAAAIEARAPTTRAAAAPITVLRRQRGLKDPVILTPPFAFGSMNALLA